MKVSFILPSFNRRDILKKVLREISQRCYAFSYEVRVLDNHSHDGSCEMVRSEFPTVHLYALEENLGAISRNIGIRDACGEYIVMLDDDSYPLSNAIEQALDVFENDSDEKIGCIAFNIQRADGSYETAGIHTAFTGCAAMFRRRTFDVVGGYPENYLFYVEEYDLSCRMVQSGLSILNFKELEFVHLKTVVNRDFNKNIERLIRNNMLLWSKYLPADLAQRQIETEIWRYEKIALKENAIVGYLNGLEMGKLEIERFREDRAFEMGQFAAEEMLALKTIEENCIKAAQFKGSAGAAARVVIYSAGKLLYFIVRSLRQQDCEIVAIVDDNMFMQESGFGGLPVISHEKMLEIDFDVILLGTTSLSLSDVFESRLVNACPEKPLFRLSHYDTLSDYL